ncbi:MAG: tetratricopeptide repeat protein [Planctomycetes bacterium]|nr:tetratricopeptide repeat protein [Planctomycetota bacterium]
MVRQLDWTRIKGVLADAFDIHIDDRPALLDEACGGDVKLRREVESLLAADAYAEELLPNSVHRVRVDPGAVAVREDGHKLPGFPDGRIGRFRILRLIAEGGMGVVYLAEQENPRREVALKLIKGGLLSPAIRKRFKHEAGALGRLHHPGIVQVHEAGTVETELGDQPFVAMEFAPGQTLTDYAKRASLSPRDCMSLMATIADAVHHAHQHGVIHRDLKPANILVDADGQPKIFDFGVARLTDADTTLTTMHTHTGQVIGTLPYMSPEQASGNPDDVDIRCDVYALGVLTYQLLSGRLPHVMHDKMVFDALRMIREEDPLPLSSIDTKLRGDIDTIVGKALEKDKTLRYDSAAAFASDIRRFLEHQPILARPTTAFYQLSRFGRRNRVLVGGILAVFVALVVGVIGTTWQAVVAGRAQNLAHQRLVEVERSQKDLKKITDFQSEMLMHVVPEMLGHNAISDLRRRIQDQLRSADTTGVEIDEALNDFDVLLDQVNRADFGRELIHRNILSRAAETMAKDFADQPLIEARLLVSLAQMYESLGASRQVELHLRTALALRQTELGEEHYDTASAMSELAACLRLQGHYEEAVSLFNKALKVHRDAMWMTALGLCFLDQNRKEEAEPILKEAWKIAQSELSENHPATLACINNLALLYGDDELEEAARLHTIELELSKRVNGPEHPETLISMNNLAIVRAQQNQFDKATQLHNEAIDISSRINGRNHTDTLWLRNRLGTTYVQQGRPEDACQLFEQTLEAFRNNDDVEHPESLTAMLGLATSYSRCDRYMEAEPLFLRTIETRRQLFGGASSDTATALIRLASLYVATERYGEAKPLYMEGLSIRRHVLGNTHRKTIAALSLFGRMYLKQEDYTAAAPLLREAVDSSRLPNREQELGQYLTEYGKCLIGLQEFEDAETALLEAPQLLAAAMGPSHKRTIATITAIIGLYEAWNKPIKAEEYRTMKFETPRE